MTASNWHTQTQARMRTATTDQLHFIITDATEAAAAGESVGNPKVGQYLDEAGYARAELRRREEGAKAPVTLEFKARPGACCPICQGTALLPTGKIAVDGAVLSMEMSCGEAKCGATFTDLYNLGGCRVHQH